MFNLTPNQATATTSHGLVTFTDRYKKDGCLRFQCSVNGENGKGGRGAVINAAPDSPDFERARQTRLSELRDEAKNLAALIEAVEEVDPIQVAEHLQAIRDEAERQARDAQEKRDAQYAKVNADLTVRRAVSQTLSLIKLAKERAANEETARLAMTIHKVSDLSETPWDELTNSQRNRFLDAASRLVVEHGGEPFPLAG